MKRRPIVLGLCGEKGSGKGTFANVLVKALDEVGVFARIMSTRDLLQRGLIPIAENFGLGIHARSTLQGFANFLEAANPGCIARAMRREIQGVNAPVVLYDAVRWHHDVQVVKNMGGLIVYITAPPRLRYERAIARNEKTDEAAITFEEFLRGESAPTERSIPRIGRGADWVFVNDQNDPERLRETVAAFYIRELMPRLKAQGGHSLGRSI